MDIKTFSLAWAGVSAVLVCVLMLAVDHQAARRVGSLFRRGPRRGIGRPIGWLIGWIIIAVGVPLLVSDHSDRERENAFVGFSASLVVGCILSPVVVALCRRKPSVSTPDNASGSSAPSSFELLKSSWFHKVVRVGIKEQHTIDVRANQWTGREVIKVDGQVVVDHHVFKESNRYQFRVGKDEQYDVAVKVSTFGLSINVAPAATSVPVQMSTSTEIHVHGGGGCSGCFAGLGIVALTFLIIALLMLRDCNSAFK